MKKIILSVMCLLMLLAISGCGLSKEEKEKREKYFYQAKENATKYIENKYGFTPKIGTTKCTFDNSDNFSTSCTAKVIVNANYKDKWFKVVIDGSKQTQEGMDNYQYDLITTDLIKMVNNNFISSYKYKFYYGSHKNDIEGLIDLYYDGNNLEEVMEKADLKGVLEFIDGVDFESLQNKLTSQNFSIFKKLYIINYKSLDSYKKVSTHDYGLLTSSGTDYFEEPFYENSKYLKDVIVLYYNDVKFYDFK